MNPIHPNSANMTPEAVAAMTCEELRALAPEQLKDFTGEHYAALSPEQIKTLYPLSTIGPTWQVDEDGNWLLPEHTLGWEIAGWIAEWLHGPDGSESFVLTLEQLRFILWWYAVDSSGNFVYRTGVLQRLKGWGLPRQRPVARGAVPGRARRPFALRRLGR